MLEFDIPRVNIIKQKGRDDPESCCCELLCEWLDSDHGITPKSWTTLLTTLKQIKKLNSVTDEIEKDLTAQSQLTMCVTIFTWVHYITVIFYADHRMNLIAIPHPQPTPVKCCHKVKLLFNYNYSVYYILIY